MATGLSSSREFELQLAGVLSNTDGDLVVRALKVPVFLETLESQGLAEVHQATFLPP